jgi:hypothetical protein
MPTTISDLWIPDIWLATMREKQATFPSLLNSGVAVNNPKAAELASGPGEVAMIPFFRDITDQDDELQLESAEPLIDNIITAGVMKAGRVDAFDETGDDATADRLMGIDLFINAKSLMGELADDIQNGALWVHPTVLAALELADETSFHKVSHGPWTIRTYPASRHHAAQGLAV